MQSSAPRTLFAAISVARDRSAKQALVELAMNAALIGATITAALALGIDLARAATASVSEPDTGLVIALLVAAVAAMVALSAAAVRIVGRPRR